MNEMFPLEQLKFSNDYVSSKGFNLAKQNQFYGPEDWGDFEAVNSSCSGLGFCEDNGVDEGQVFSKQRGQVQSVTNYGSLDHLYFDMGSTQFHPRQEDEITKLASIENEISELIEPQREKPHAFPLSSLGILKNYGNKFGQLNCEKINASSYGCDTRGNEISGRKLSTDAIIRLAGENFIQTFSQRVDDMSMLSHPFSSSFFGGSDEEIRDVELLQCLLALAEKVGQQQFERATKLLDLCDELTSKEGNTIQRLVYYFCQALRERIGGGKGRLSAKVVVALDEEIMSLSPSIIALHQEIPFYQVSQFTGIQAIVENVAHSKKVHVIDLEIRNGTQCTVLMQALTARCGPPLEHLKITAVGTTSKPSMDEIGRRLMAFAHSMNLPFSFNVVMVDDDMVELNKSLFELDKEEAVAFYSSYYLWTMIARPDRLDRLMKVVRTINPCVMVVSELEANLNSPVFVTRFIEGLFFYGTHFDSIKYCMGHDRPNRLITESIYYGNAIRNLVVAEGEERMMRHVSISVWRAFFARFAMVEIELSMSSLYQASLVAKSFACGSSCTLDMDEKCLLIGWKGTPLISHSAWKFP